MTLNNSSSVGENWTDCVPTCIQNRIERLGRGTREGRPSPNGLVEVASISPDAFQRPSLPG